MYSQLGIDTCKKQGAHTVEVVSSLYPKQIQQGKTVSVSGSSYNNVLQKQIVESKDGRPLWKQYLPFIVFVGLATLLLLTILFIPAKTVTKLFAASTALAWTSFWGTVIYITCLSTKNQIIAWAVVIFPLLVWSIVTILVYIGAINLDATTPDSDS